MTSLEVLDLLNTKSPQELTQQQAAGLRAYLDANPGIFKVLGDRDSVEQYLAQLPDVAGNSGVTTTSRKEPAPKAKRSATTKRDPEPQTDPKTDNHGSVGTLVLACVLTAFVTAAGVWMYVRLADAPPAPVAENDPDSDDDDANDAKETDASAEEEPASEKGDSKNPQRTNSGKALPKQPGEQEPGKQPSSHEKPVPQKPVPKKPRTLSWHGWEIIKTQGAKVIRKTEWDLDDPDKPKHRVSLVTGRAKVTLKKELKIGAADLWLRIAIQPTGEGTAQGKLEVRVNGNSVGRFNVPGGGLAPAPLVALQGKQAIVQIVYTPAGRTNEVAWKSLALDTVPKNRVELLASHGGPVKLARFITSPYPLLEDEGRFWEEDLEDRLVDDDRYTGSHALRVPTADHGSKLAGFKLAIRENPAEGEFRYLRFAFRKKGGGLLLFELANSEAAGRPFRYAAGKKAGSVSPPVHSFQLDLVDEWIVMTRDLYRDFGRFELTGITVRSRAGKAVLVDHIYLARDRGDFERIAVKRAEPVKNSPMVKIALDHPQAFDALGAMALIEIDGRRGAGMVVTKDGKIATTAQVAVAPGKKATVTLHDGRKFRGRTLGIDRAKNVAVIQIEALGEFKHVPLDATWPCGVLYAFAPNGNWKETQAVISGSAAMLGAIGGLAWSNVGINTEHSGGPLITTDGRLVAIHSPAAPLGGGLHIPAATIEKTWRKLVEPDAPRQ